MYGHVLFWWLAGAAALGGAGGGAATRLLWVLRWEPRIRDWAYEQFEQGWYEGWDDAVADRHQDTAPPLALDKSWGAAALKTPALAPDDSGDDGEREGRAFHGLNHAQDPADAEADRFIAELHDPGPPTDERLERVVLPLAEDTGAWQLRIADEAAAWRVHILDRFGYDLTGAAT